MTNTTQCPACQTRFKVSPAQLAAAGGLVRCGRCAHVFNANDHFVAAQPQPPVAAAPAPKPAPAPAPEPAPTSTPAPVATAASSSSLSQPIDDIDDFELEVPDFDPMTAALPEDPLASYPEEVGTPEAVDGPTSADVEAFQQALNQALQGTPASMPIGNPFAEPHTPVDVPSATPITDAFDDDEEVPAIFDTRRTQPPAAQEEPLVDTVDAVESDDNETATEVTTEPGYDPAVGSPSSSKKRNPLITVLVLLFSIIALLLLAGQLVYINRTLIVSQAPELRPTLEMACKRLGCTIPLPTDQEYIRTEWSELSFVPEHANLVQLSATLKNHAPYPQALPVLEVTLKDSDNQVMIRKVFTSREYLKSENQKLTSFAANSELKITMRFDVGKVHAQGYSLYWFYP